MTAAVQAAVQLVDTRTLGKPPSFTGRVEDWMMWSFKFESWASLLPPVAEGSTVEQALEWCTTVEEDGLAVAQMNPNAVLASRNVYYMLTQSLDDRAVAILRRAPKRGRAHGVEALEERV